MRNYHFGGGSFLRVVRSVCLGGAVLLSGAFAAGLVVSGDVQAKTPGKTYCFLKKCHRVKTIAETRRQIGRVVTLLASHYDDAKRDRFNPSNITSSGAYFKADRPDNAASPNYPDGTRLLIWNPANKRTAVVRINNAGPYWGRRNLDVSKATAVKLGFAKRGVATLKGIVLSAPTRAEARYRRGRTYAPVPGYMGVFETIDVAMLNASRAINKNMAPPVHLIAGRDSEPRVSSNLIATAGKPAKAKAVRVAALVAGPVTATDAAASAKAQTTSKPEKSVAKVRPLERTKTKAPVKAKDKPKSTPKRASPARSVVADGPPRLTNTSPSKRRSRVAEANCKGGSTPVWVMRGGQRRSICVRPSRGGGVPSTASSPAPSPAPLFKDPPLNWSVWRS